ncbi:MAG: hypothetical protein H6740_23285 [Alphaproteobacteria bacterium]|nr:hypothetical protein [Alphaproteobacteria bacterium]
MTEERQGAVLELRPAVQLCAGLAFISALLLLGRTALEFEGALRLDLGVAQDIYRGTRGLLFGLPALGLVALLLQAWRLLRALREVEAWPNDQEAVRLALLRHAQLWRVAALTLPPAFLATSAALIHLVDF